MNDFTEKQNRSEIDFASEEKIFINKRSTGSNLSNFEIPTEDIYKSGSHINLSSNSIYESAIFGDDQDEAHLVKFNVTITAAFPAGKLNCKKI